MEVMRSKSRIAVVGAGIAGITAAYLLGKRHDVTLIERNHYLGGHTNTIVVQEKPGDDVPVDTGFIVCNPKTYPLFYRLLAEWGVPLRNSDMSFGYFCDDSKLGYVGPSLREFLGRYRNFFKPSFLRMIVEQQRFNRLASVDLDSGVLNDLSLGAYLARIGASEYFQKNYLLPIAAAVWSSPDAGMLDFPASTFVRFLRNHGMLTPNHQPTWQTVVGGSHAYVRAFRSKFTGEVLESSTVRAVLRNTEAVTIHFHKGNSRSFDHVVMASHANETLAQLTDATDDERRLLSAWSYHLNPTVLHTDASVLPPDRRLWASWNYRRRESASALSQVPITYYMNRLQGLKSKRDYFVTLNAGDSIDPATVIYSVNYTHPVYTSRSFAAQHELKQMNGSRRTFFCGSYMGYGFHEDAVASAAAIGEKWGVTL